MFGAQLAANLLDHGRAVIGAPDLIAAGIDLELEVLPCHTRNAGLSRAVDQRQLKRGGVLQGYAPLGSERRPELLGCAGRWSGRLWLPYRCLHFATLFVAGFGVAEAEMSTNDGVGTADSTALAGAAAGESAEAGLGVAAEPL
ncbi:MAG TPA: hypothetical protein VI094_22520, partial [Propionibacteriaceae bacterium]